MAASFTRLEFYSVVQKSATERPRLNGRRYAIPSQHKSAVGRAERLLDFGLGSERKQEGKRGSRTIIRLRSQNPPCDDGLTSERLPKGTKADDDRCDAVGELPNESAAKESCCDRAQLTPRTVRDDYSMAIPLRESSFGLEGSSARAR